MANAVGIGVPLTLFTKLFILCTLLTTIWTGGAFYWLSGRVDQSNALHLSSTGDTCDADSVGAAGSPGPTAAPVPAAQAPIPLSLDGSPPTIQAGAGRGAFLTAVTLKPKADVSLSSAQGQVQVGSVAPSRSNGGTLDPPTVGAEAVGDLVSVRACVVVPPVISWSGLAGTYTGQIVITDPRFEADPIPFTVTVQARYLWFLAPGILWAVLAAYFVAGQLPPDKDKARLLATPVSVASLFTAIGAAAVAFGAAASNPEWGGGLVQCGAVIGVMYGAATAVIATGNKIGSPKTEVDRAPGTDEPKKLPRSAAGTNGTQDGSDRTHVDLTDAPVEPALAEA